MLAFHLHIKMLFIKEVKLQCREISVHPDLYEMYCFCDFSHVSFKEEEGTGWTKDDQENSINQMYPILQNFPIILFIGTVWTFIVR